MEELKRGEMWWEWERKVREMRREGRKKEERETEQKLGGRLDEVIHRERKGGTYGLEQLSTIRREHLWAHHHARGRTSALRSMCRGGRLIFLGWGGEGGWL